MEQDGKYYCDKCGKEVPWEPVEVKDLNYVLVRVIVCRDCRAKMMDNMFEQMRPPDPTGLPRVTRWTRFWRWFDDTALRVLRRR